MRFDEMPQYPAYDEYDKAVQKSAAIHGTIPHCDSRVLHRSGCEYCDDRPELHEVRDRLGINHTGEYDPTKLPCPAEKRRSLENIEAWHGNIKMTPEQKAKDDAYWKEWHEEFDRLWGNPDDRDRAADDGYPHVTWT